MSHEVAAVNPRTGQSHNPKKSGEGRVREAPDAHLPARGGEDVRSVPAQHQHGHHHHDGCDGKHHLWVPWYRAKPGCDPGLTHHFSLGFLGFSWKIQDIHMMLRK